jgi:RHS repeat-associated protein
MRVIGRVVLLALVGLSPLPGMVAAAPARAVPGKAARLESPAGEAFAPLPSGELPADLVVPAMQSLDGGRQLSDQALVKRLNPAAIAARTRSRTAFHDLDPARAARVVREELPGVVAVAPAAPSQLPAGGTIERYLSSDSARISLPGNRHAVAFSMTPMATRSRSGAYRSLNLGLHEAGDGYAVADAAVPVHIPKALAEGIATPSNGVSLTPVEASGRPLRGSGALDGAAVLYANTQEDTDTAVKATASGFETDSLLRSTESPERLSFRVGVPAGAALVPVGVSGAARVVADGKTLATIPAPAAQDAEGTSVPVVTKVSGTTIRLYVAHRDKGYRYPITVDPTVVDTKLGGLDENNWRGEFGGEYGGHYIYPSEEYGGWWYIDLPTTYVANQWGAVLYPTQGESHIYALTMETAASGVPENIENHMVIFGGGGWETSDLMPKNYGRTATTICLASCAASGGTRGNVAGYWVNATGNFNSVGTPEGVSLYTATVYIAQSNGPSAVFDTTSPSFAVDGKKNALYGTNGWIGKNDGAVEVDESDPGVGVAKTVFSVNGGEKWTMSPPSWEGPVQYAESVSKEVSVHSWEHPEFPVALPDGEQTLEAEAFNGMGSTAKVSTKVKVDRTAPYGISVSGLPANNEVSDSYRALKLTAKATDGSGSVISSGIASLKLAVDGREVGSPNGSCSPGPCTASGEWSLGDAENLGAGKHVITITATDGAGNVTTSSETSFTVHHATPTSFGPGTVNPVTGDFDMEEADVSIKTSGPALAVTRNYDSREASDGAGGAFGAPWSLSIGAAQELTRNASTKNMVLTSASGGLSTFVYQGGGHYGSPKGDQNLTLSANTGETEFTLTDDGATTTFRHTSGEGENVWRPAVAADIGGTNATQYLYQTVGGIVEPSEELGPIPAGVSCAPELKRGCRALTFSYASSTGASGEAPSEWGEYTGRLAKVSFTAYDPAAKAMTTKAVAQYSYDSKGRLRAVWDPRISPALKRTFGYDPEGHLTAAAEAGQEPWLFGYGTASLDTSPGRLVTAGRPVASTALASGPAPASTAAPSVSLSQPIVGHSDQAYPGTWSQSPLRYGYQWMRCNASGGECTAIGGAINSAYTPVSADVGHALLVLVTATNADGSTVGSSPATAGCSGVGSEGSPVKGVETALPASATATIEYGVPVSGAGAPYSLGSSEAAKWGQTDVPVEATAMFPPDEPMSWPASDYRRASIDYLDAADRVVNVARPGGAISTQEYNSYNDVVRTLSPDNREKALKEGSKSAEVAKTLDTQSTFGSEGLEQLGTLGPLHTVKLASGATVVARTHTVYSYDENAPAGGPYRLVTKVTTGAQIAGEPEADIRTTTKSYAGQNNLGWALREPTATQVDPTGLKLTHTSVYDPTSGDLTEARTPAAGAPSEELLSGFVDRTTFGSERMSLPEDGMTLDKEGNVWVTDTRHDRVVEYSSGGTFIKEFGSAGKGLGQFEEPRGIAIDGEGHVWVADTRDNRLEEFSSTGAFITSIEFATSERQYRFEHPTAVVYSPVNSMLYVADSGNNGVRVFNMKGQAQYKIGLLTGAAGTEPGQFNNPEGLTIDSSGDLWVADTRNGRVQEFNSKGEFLTQIKGPLYEPHGVAIGPEGNVFVTDSNFARVAVYSPTGTLQYRFGSEGEGLQNMSWPTALAFDSTGNLFVLDSGNSRVEKWIPAGLVHDPSGTGGTHGEQTIYYTAGVNAEAAACGEHPEWGGLPCEKRPAAQPETSGVPNLPVTMITYNLWDVPLVSTETFGASTRTTTDTYDGADRLLTSTVAATADTAVPTVSIEYSSETGLPVKQSTTVEGGVQSIERTFNRLGEQTAYKDADGNTSTTEYDVDGRETATNDGKGTQSLSYDPTTGSLTKLVDSAAGTFTGAYDVEGNLVNAGYPNGMSVKHTYDPTGRETGIEYVKTTHCTSGCTWYSESEAPSIHGQTLSQTSTLSSQAYTYDAAGRLTQVQDTPVGAGCTTRVYTLDEETNITSLTTRAPGSEGKCAGEGGAAANHSYDSANRLTDAGVAYDDFGDIIRLPAGDAGGAALTSTFYADGTLASQTQSGETIGYHLDPLGRPRQAIATGKTSSTITMHYSGGSNTPAWSEETSGQWTRNIPGLEAGVVATQHGGEAPVLQIEDLHGNIVGTAALSETATALLSKGDSTEYGLPRTGSPAKYSWLGGLGLRTEFPTGIIAMGARSYVPEIGRFLQPDPVEGGSANEYSYTYGDPVNTSDPSGEFTAAMPSWVNGFLSEQAELATEAAIQRAAEEQAAREEAEAAAAAEAQQAWLESFIASERAVAGGGGGGGGKQKAGGNRRAMASLALAQSCNILYCHPLAPSQNVPCKACEKKTEREEHRKEKEEHKRKQKERLEEELACGDATAGYSPNGDVPDLGSGVYHGGGRSRGVSSCPPPDTDPNLPSCWPLCGDVMEAWKQWPERKAEKEPDEHSGIRRPQSDRQARRV